MTNDIENLKKEIRELRMEKAIDELKKEVTRYKKKDIFAITFASCFKRIKKRPTKKSKNIKKSKKSRRPKNRQ